PEPLRPRPSARGEGRTARARRAVPRLGGINRLRDRLPPPLRAVQPLRGRAVYARAEGRRPDEAARLRDRPDRSAPRAPAQGQGAAPDPACAGRTCSGPHRVLTTTSAADRRSPPAEALRRCAGTS